MLPRLKILLYILMFFALKINLFSQTIDTSIVEKYGQLRVEGNKIVNQFGTPIVLRGMSLFWSQWMAQYYNENCIKWLKEDWKCTVVRAAMGVEMGGYLENPTTEINKIKKVIEACIDEGLYVIVDWHDHHAHENENAAIEFFKEIATLYGNKSNIIYEIYNEPEQISWKNEVKPYSERVINEIRSIDSNNIILVGSPTWSQDVDIAANDPIISKNIAYALHFYAATHKQYLRDKAKNALAKGVALFVSEFGTCEANGSGILDYGEMDEWLNFMEENKISWCNWSIADKQETSSALMPGASGQGGWIDTQITESGKLIKQKILVLNTPTNIKQEKEIIEKEFNLLQNYPNPFNSSTIISFSINKNSNIKFDIYNSLGEKVQNILNGNYIKGDHSFTLNFLEYSSGNYFLSCEIENQRKIIKMQYLR